MTTDGAPFEKVSDRKFYRTIAIVGLVAILAIAAVVVLPKVLEMNSSVSATAAQGLKEAAEKSEKSQRIDRAARLIRKTVQMDNVTEIREDTYTELGDNTFSIEIVTESKILKDSQGKPQVGDSTWYFREAGIELRVDKVD